MKIILVILDGAGDIGKQTPFFLAKKPNIDFLVSKGKCGFLDIGYGKDINSDFGYLTILGNPKELYPGRGYIAALGTGLKPGEKDTCIRGNFATLDKNGNLLDRRAGREETDLDYFAEILDGTEIDGIKFTLRKSSGHRVAIILSGRNLSPDIVPNDPKKTGVPLPQVKPKNESAKFTASVLNKFVYRANKILSKEPANRKRRYPANTILIRNTGMKKSVPSVKERFGLKGCCIAGIAVAKGVTRFLGMDVIEVEGATGLPDTNLKGKADAVIESMKKYDFIFLHINGTDTYSHNRLPLQKKEFIEKIDAQLGRMLKETSLKKTIFILTCDHRSASSPSHKGYEHLPDPVPILISGDNIPSDGVKKFDEKNCEKGSLRIKGEGLLELVLEMVKGK